MIEYNLDSDSDRANSPNEGGPAARFAGGKPFSAAPDEDELLMSSFDPIWALLTENGHFFSKKGGTPGEHYACGSQWPMMRRSLFGNCARLAVNMSGPFTLTREFNAKTKKTQVTRVFQDHFDGVNGQRIPQSVTIEADLLVQNFEPPPGEPWRSEWTAAVKECEPMLARFRQSRLADEAAAKIESELSAKAEMSARDPAVALGQAISQGVAQALAQLEVKTGGRA